LFFIFSENGVRKCNSCSSNSGEWYQQHQGHEFDWNAALDMLVILARNVHMRA